MEYKKNNLLSNYISVRSHISITNWWLMNMMYKDCCMSVTTCWDWRGMSLSLSCLRNCWIAEIKFVALPLEVSCCSDHWDVFWWYWNWLWTHFSNQTQPSKVETEKRKNIPQCLILHEHSTKVEINILEGNQDYPHEKRTLAWMDANIVNSCSVGKEA